MVPGQGTCASLDPDHLSLVIYLPEITGRILERSGKTKARAMRITSMTPKMTRLKATRLILMRTVGLWTMTKLKKAFRTTGTYRLHSWIYLFPLTRGKPYHPHPRIYLIPLPNAKQRILVNNRKRSKRS